MDSARRRRSQRHGVANPRIVRLIAADFRAAEANLHKALTRVGDCQAAYDEASDRMRRQFNLAFFKRLVIYDETVVLGELAEPWDVILSEELRRAVAAQEVEDLKDAIERAGRRSTRRSRQPTCAGRTTTAAPDWGGGWSPNMMVRLVGQLSNPSVALVAVFEAVGGALQRPAGSQRPIAVEPASPRLGNGVVQRAVVKVLAAASVPMRCAEVQQAVERLLGHPVSKNSVSWSLAADARSKKPRFARTTRGYYQLRR